MRKNKQHHVKGQQKWFHLNGHTVGFLPQIQSQLEIRTKQVETTRKVVQMMFPLNGQTGVFNLYAHKLKPPSTAVREMSPCSSLEPRFKDEDDYERGRDLTSSFFVYSCKHDSPENFSMYFFSAEKLARLLVFIEEG